MFCIVLKSEQCKMIWWRSQGQRTGWPITFFTLANLCYLKPFGKGSNSLRNDELKYNRWFGWLCSIAVEKAYQMFHHRHPVQLQSLPLSLFHLLSLPLPLPSLLSLKYMHTYAHTQANSLHFLSFLALLAKRLHKLYCCAVFSIPHKVSPAKRQSWFLSHHFPDSVSNLDPLVGSHGQKPKQETKVPYNAITT